MCQSVCYYCTWWLLLLLAKLPNTFRTLFVIDIYFITNRCSMYMLWNPNPKIADNFKKLSSKPINQHLLLWISTMFLCKIYFKTLSQQHSLLKGALPSLPNERNSHKTKLNLPFNCFIVYNIILLQLSILGI